MTFGTGRLRGLIVAALLAASLSLVLPASGGQAGNSAPWSASRYLAVAAKKAKHGDKAEAVRLYRECREHFAAEGQTALAAARHELPLARELGDSAAIAHALDFLRQHEKTWRLDAASLRALAKIEQVYGSAESAERLLAAALAAALDKQGGNPKTAVAAGANLIAIARAKRDSARIEEVLERLRGLSADDLDLTDREHIGRLHLDNARAIDGEAILWRAAEHCAVSPDRRQTDAALRVFGRLASLYQARGDADGTARLAGIQEKLGRVEIAGALRRGIAETYRDAPEAEDRKAALRAVVALDRRKTPDASSLAAGVESADPGILDTRDRYRLALLAIARNEQPRRLHDVLTELRNPATSNVSMMLDVLSKLLAQEQATATGARGTQATTTPGQLVNWAASNYPTATFTSEHRYRLGRLFLEHGVVARGEQVLTEVANGAASTAAAKALWALAKQADQYGDARVAMQRYGTYIQRYPENARIAAKAYTRLVDLYASTGHAKTALDMLQKLRQFAESSADWLAQLSAARDLAFYQAKELEAATFALGLAGARATIAAKDTTALERLRVHVEVSRYAFDTERKQLADEYAKAAQELAGAIDPGPLHEADLLKLERLTSLGHLLRMRSALATGVPDVAETAAQAFLSLRPHDPDRNFALWHLGQAQEAQGKTTAAAETYRQVGGAFASAAASALGRLAR